MTLKVAVWPAMTVTPVGCLVIEGAAAVPVGGFEVDLEALVMPAQPVIIASETSAASDRAERHVSLCFAAANTSKIKVEQRAQEPVIVTDYELTRNGYYWPPDQTEDRCAACPSPRDI